MDTGEVTVERPRCTSDESVAWRTWAERVVQPRLSSEESAFHLYEDGPATLSTGRLRRFYHFWDLRRHEILCLFL